MDGAEYYSKLEDNGSDRQPHESSKSSSTVHPISIEGSRSSRSCSASSELLLRGSRAPVAEGTIGSSTINLLNSVMGVGILALVRCVTHDEN